jgi:AcrR family transcriptional regulator
MTDLTPSLPTKQRILDASRRLFSERGFHRTSVRDIAGQVGVTDAALYRHFRSKRELLEALLEEHGLSEAYRRLATVPDDVPLERALINMTLGALRFHQENQDVLKVILLEGIAGDDAVRRQFQQITHRWEHGVADIIRRRAAAEGLDPALSPSLAAQLVSYLWGNFTERLLGACTITILDQAGALTPEARELARVAVLRIVRGARAVEPAG